MLRRVPVDGDVVFCGGVALNACLRRLIEQELGLRLFVPEQPQLVAAVGGALLAAASNSCGIGFIQTARAMRLDHDS